MALRFLVVYEVSAAINTDFDFTCHVNASIRPTSCADSYMCGMMDSKTCLDDAFESLSVCISIFAHPVSHLVVKFGEALACPIIANSE